MANEKLLATATSLSGGLYYLFPEFVVRIRRLHQRRAMSAVEFSMR
jgi:hypothetical protein